jgi:hypothetical protein
MEVTQPERSLKGETTEAMLRASLKKETIAAMLPGRSSRHAIMEAMPLASSMEGITGVMPPESLKSAITEAMLLGSWRNAIMAVTLPGKNLKHETTEAMQHARSLRDAAMEATLREKRLRLAVMLPGRSSRCGVMEATRLVTCKSATTEATLLERSSRSATMETTLPERKPRTLGLFFFFFPIFHASKRSANGAFYYFRRIFLHGARPHITSY